VFQPGTVDHDLAKPAHLRMNAERHGSLLN